MANFYHLNEPKLVKVQPFFTHLPLLTQSQQSEMSFSEKLIDRPSHESLQNSTQPQYTHRRKSLDRDCRNSQTIKQAKNIYFDRDVGDRHEERRKRRLSLVSRLVLLQLQSSKYLPAHQRELLSKIQIRNGKEAYVQKQMKSKLDQLNRTADMSSELQGNRKQSHHSKK